MAVVNTALKGQVDTVGLDTVYIRAGRITTPYLSLPSAVTQIDLTSRTQYLSHTSLSEAVSEVPGLFALNGQNYAQDLRISIRGFGARSAFGIRGIKLVVDGIPETTPDGQGQLDNVSISDISSIEVLRGSSAAQYGNAAGGVIEISTYDMDNDPFNEVSIRLGSFGLQQYRVASLKNMGSTKVLVSGTHFRSTGYRKQSRLRQTNLLGKLKHEWGASSFIQWQASYLNSPLAEDPGGINLDQASETPKSARDRNISFDAGESIRHWKSSIKLNASVAPNLMLKANAFLSGRNFDGRLPFSNGGAIDLNRTYGGQTSQLTYSNVSSSSINKLSIGYEYWFQNDDRDRFINDDGERGAMTLSQKEIFRNFGIYLIDQWSNEQWSVKTSIRYDSHLLKVDDLFLSNGNDSGKRNLSAFNYQLGLTKTLGVRNSIFSNYSTSFETPLLSELSANPNDSGGFNEDLEPMKARTFEIGLKGMPLHQINYSISLFNINTSDELIPFELEDFPGRTFFRNAGKTKRNGLEAAFSYKGVKDLTLSSSYTYSNFSFREYIVEGTDLSDNALPGIPQHQWSSSASYNIGNLVMRLSAQLFSKIQLTDQNDVQAEGYQIINARFGYKVDSAGFDANVFLGVNNLLCENYFDNLRLNAFGNRFYEPAAELNFEAGFSIIF